MSFPVQPGYNRASSPFQRAPSPYQRAPSPYQKAPSSPGGFLIQQQQQFAQQPYPTSGGQITANTITYTTTTGPDGNIVYHPFRAESQSYQTPQGIVSGIQWVPVGATALLPAGAMPATADIIQSLQRIEYQQREEEKRHRREEKDAARREKERHKREKAEEKEHREARERRERGGRISRSGSPYGAPILSGRISPYAAPAPLPARPISPYYGPGGLPSAGRPASPYHGGGALPARPSSPYHTGVPIRSSSPYHGGGALPNIGRPASPYQAGGALPGNTYGSGYVSNQVEIERRMADLGIGSRSEHERRQRMSGGNTYAVAEGGNYPNMGYSSISPVNSATGTGGYPYSATSPSVGQFPAGRAPSPSPYGHHSPNAFQPQPSFNEQGMLLPPDGFSRPFNQAMSYPNFDAIKIQDMEDLMDDMPRLPRVLVTHDVRHDDWIRLMTDLSSAWTGRLPIPESERSAGRVRKNTTVTAELVDAWNASFFILRGAEIILYKGRERRSGDLIGQVDMNLPGFDDGYDKAYSTDSSESEDSDSEDDAYGAGRYGNVGGIYGRQSEGQIAELREAKRRRKEMEAGEKRRKKEKKARKRVRELERKYSIYLTCVPLTQVSYR